MKLGIENRVALVMGAGGGLGAAISSALAREGALVAGGDLNTDALDATRTAIESAGGSFVAVPADLSDLESLDAAVARVVAELGEIDILVNNTGGPPPSPAVGVPVDVWQSHFASMVSSVLHLTDAVLPSMRRRRWGRIITSASSGVVAPIPNLGISNALRSTLLGWSKTVANEVGGDGVTANIVLPGRIATARIVSLDQARATREGRPVEDVTAASVASIPVGRYGRPEEYGDAVAFLASDRASFINGSVLRVDGGMIPSI
jgi:3-oxoacyl-[acyl-carrier protein] reductase